MRGRKEGKAVTYVAYESLIGKTFGKLTVLEELPWRDGDNKVYFCKCDCGAANCKRYARVRRGNLTRKVDWVLTCGANVSGKTGLVHTEKRFNTVQKNSTTGVPGVGLDNRNPGMYRVRICIKGKRRSKSNITFEEAVRLRHEWEEEAKEIYKEYA